MYKWCGYIFHDLIYLSYSSLLLWWMALCIILLCNYRTHSDERHPRPGTKRPRDGDDEEEEEDLNESNYDEVCSKLSSLLYVSGF